MRPPHWALSLYADHLHARTERALADPRRTQEALLRRILACYVDTELGRSLGLAGIRSFEAFRARVPVTDDGYYRPYVEAVLRENRPGVLHPGALHAVAMTSGTSGSGTSKPVAYPRELIKAYKQFELEVGLHFMRETRNYALLDTHWLVTSGSPECERSESGVVVGYGTGIMTIEAPAMAQRLIRPSRAVLAMTDWREKIEATVAEAFPLDIRLLTGVPIFVIPLLERLLAYAAEQGRPVPNAKALWPNLAGYCWSGSPIGVYEARLRELIGPDVPFVELYTATESPLGYQHRVGRPGLVPSLQATVFEFQPADAPLDAPRLGFDEVTVGVPYRVLVTTQGGLFAYRQGDVVEFTSVRPPVFRVLGREQEEISLGYEKIPYRLIRRVLDEAAAAHGAAVHNFFLGPQEAEGKLAYHWGIEFRVPPADPGALARSLDALLHEESAFYAAMRQQDAILSAPRVTVLPTGLIERYVLDTRQFGQGKFPHLYNRADVPERILALV